MVWLSVNSTERAASDYLQPAALDAWMKEQSAAPTAVLMDEDGVIGRAYAARTTPHLYIIDPKGVLVYAGGIDSIPSARADDIKTATNYVNQALGEAFGGKPISAAATRPYGCSIKYKSLSSPPGLPTSCGRQPPAGGNTSGPAKPVPRCFTHDATPLGARGREPPRILALPGRRQARPVGGAGVATPSARSQGEPCPATIAGCLSRPCRTTLSCAPAGARPPTTRPSG